MPNKSALRGGNPAQPLNWRTVESLGHAHFHQQGWRVLVSPYDTTSYDFVAERNDQFVRVNVKQATACKDARRSYVIARPGTNRRGVDPDLYLVWLPRERQFITLPGNFMKGRGSRKIPVSLFHHLKERLE